MLPCWVGLGTFRPVKAKEITEHHMHSEHYELPQETADLINETKANGKRVIAVGTTSCRTLESVASFHDGKSVKRTAIPTFLFIPAINLRCWMD